MLDPVVELDYIEIDDEKAVHVQAPVINETAWVLFVDQHEWRTFRCSPTGLHHLALGFLLSEKVIACLDDVAQIKIYLDEGHTYIYLPDEGREGLYSTQTDKKAIGSIDVRLRRPAPRPEKPAVRTDSSGVTFEDLAGNHAPLASDLRITTAQAFSLITQLHDAATLYQMSRGVHTSAFANSERLLVLVEDVGRHNTFDKICGACLLGAISTNQGILLSTARMSSEMITKARNMETPIVISRTSPTVMSVRLARKWNMTLIGYVRERQLRIYSGAERVMLPFLDRL